MPDASGRIRGTGWSRRAEAAFDRLAQVKCETALADAGLPCRTCGEARRDHDGLCFCVPNVRHVVGEIQVSTQLLEQSPPGGFWAVPTEPPDEVDLWLADRESAHDDGWEADTQAAWDGYNPAR